MNTVAHRRQEATALCSANDPAGAFQVTRLEGVLEETQRRMRALFDGTASYIGVLSPSGLVLDVNRTSLEFFGIERNQITGRAFWETPWWTQSDGGRARAIRFLRAFRRGRQVRDEVTVIDGQGRPRVIDVLLKPIDDAHAGVSLVIAEGHDITERKEIEEYNRRLELEMMHNQRMESLGTLAGGIAHEINTPIQYIGDNVNFLKNAFADLAALLETHPELAKAGPDVDLPFLLEEAPLAITQCLEGVEQVRRIVMAVRDFSHPGAKDTEPEHLGHLVNTTITVSRNHWKYVATIDTDIPADLPLVPCNRSALGQVILNLRTHPPITASLWFAG